MARGKHEKARRLGVVLLPPILSQLFVVCFVIFAILLVAHVCDIRSIRGLYDCASPGVLAIIHMAIDVIVMVQSYFTAKCRRRRHQEGILVVPHAFVEQSFVMVED